MSQISASELARALGARYRGGGNWITPCPCHPDGKTPSLSIGTKADGSPLLHDFGGCPNSVIWSYLIDNHIITGPGTAPSVEERAERWKKAEADRAKRENDARALLKGAIRRTQKLIDLAGAVEPCKYLDGLTIPDTTLLQIELSVLRSVIGYHPGSGDRKFADGRVIIAPIYNRRRLYGCQMIDQAGHKVMLRGTKKTSLDPIQSGSYWLPRPIPPNAEVIAIGEGIRTVLSAIEGTDYHGICCLDHSGFRYTAPKTRRHFPNAKILILADINSDGCADEMAMDAAIDVDGILCCPQFAGASGSDWNDLHRQQGLDAVRTQINALMAG